MRVSKEPWFRKREKRWYTTINGRQYNLGPDKAAAWKKYRQLVAKGGEPRDLTVIDCFEQYLDGAEGLKPNSYRNRRAILSDFAGFLGDGFKVSKLDESHLRRWLKPKGWAPSTVRSHVNYILAALNWCLKRSKIERNPLMHYERPAWERRKEEMSPDDAKKLLDASKGAFRDILSALRETGARPSELASARIENCDLETGIIVLDEHKEDEGGEPRILYLPPTLMERVKELAKGRQEGFVWRNAYGNPWKADTIYCRFKRLRKRLAIEEGAFPYACRSRFITDALEAGVDPMSVSSLVGHKRLDMIKKHYSRLSKSHLRDAAKKAVGDG